MNFKNEVVVIEDVKIWKYMHCINLNQRACPLDAAIATCWRNPLAPCVQTGFAICWRNPLAPCVQTGVATCWQNPLAPCVQTGFATVFLTQYFLKKIILHLISFTAVLKNGKQKGKTLTKKERHTQTYLIHFDNPRCLSRSEENKCMQTHG